MKKFISLLVLGVLLLVPIGAKALSFEIDVREDSCTECTEPVDGVCTTICTIAIKNNSGDLGEVKLQIIPATGVTISEVTAANGWTYSGTISDATFQSLLPVSDSAFTLATFKQTFSSSVEDCSPTIRLEDGKEYQIPTPEPTPNPPHTGVSLPVVILIGGVVVAITLYTITNKNKKMYKI